jgi:hypothetical protein
MLPRHQNIIGRWVPSAGATGFTLADRSPRRNHGTLTNMDPATDWVVSGGKLALDMDGSNDYIQCGTIPAGITNFTASCWIRANSGSGNVLQILSNANAAVSTGAHFLALVSGQLYCFAGSEVTASTGDLRDNTWHHVAVSRLGSTGRFFLDGRFIQSGTIGSNNVSSTVRLRIGTQRYSLSQFFSGILDDVILYSSGLTDGEVREIYRRGRGAGLFEERRRPVRSAAGFKPYWANRQHLIGSGVY